MKKLNNKGITTIEVILCFVLISVIATSLFATISAFNEKKIIEGYKSEITTYKYVLTRKIQDNAVEFGILDVSFDEETTEYMKVSILYGDGVTRVLEIFVPSDKTKIASIKYDGIEYKLPDLGSDKDGNKDLIIDKIQNESTANVFSLYISFYHPDIYKRYGISLVAPINYFPEKSPKGTWDVYF